MLRIFVMTSTKHSSDEIKEMDCEHCKRDGYRGIPATGFCEDCCDLVCDMCIRYHRRYEPGHIFKQTNEVLLEFCSEICDNHSDEFIKFCCEICDDVACSICKRQYHSNCSSVVHVSKYRTNLEDTKGTDLVAFIDESKAKLHFIRENAEHCLKFGSTLRDNVKTTVRKLREKAGKEFDMLDSEIAELELPDQKKLQTCLKDAIEIENYISGVNLSSKGYRKFVLLKKIKKLVDNLQNQTKSIEKATCIQGYSFVLGGVQQQGKTGITAGAGGNDRVDGETGGKLRNDSSKVENAGSVSRSFKLLQPIDGVRWLGLFLQTFLLELILMFCLSIRDLHEHAYYNQFASIILYINPHILGVGLFLSCLCKLLFFMQVTDIALSHKYGIGIFKLWSLIAYCITVPLSIVNLLFHVIPIYLAFCVDLILFLFDELTPCAGVPLKMLFACAYGLVQKVGLVVSFLVLSVTDFIVTTLYFNSNIYRWNWDIPWWLIIFFSLLIWNNLILISSFGIRYIEIWKRGKSDFGWFFSNKSFFTLRQSLLLGFGQSMHQSN